MCEVSDIHDYLDSHKSCEIPAWPNTRQANRTSQPSPRKNYSANFAEMCGIRNKIRCIQK